MARFHAPDADPDGGIPAAQSLEERAMARREQNLRPSRRFVASVVAVLLASLAPLAPANAAAVTGTRAMTFAADTPLRAIVGLPTRLVFLATPSSVAAGSPFSPELQVAIADAEGNTITNGIAATVRLSMGTNPVGGVLTCTGGFDAATVAGVATFQGCGIDDQASGYTLIAAAVSVSSAVSLAYAQSDPFEVGPPKAVLLIASSASVVTWGGSITLSVSFAGGAGESVTLENSRDNATWSTIAAALVGDDDHATFAYRPVDNRYYRASFAGSDEISANTTSSVRVIVRQIALLRPTNHGRVTTVSAGTVVSFTTTVRPARPELPPATVTYVVYQLQGTRWVQIVNLDLVGNAAGQTRLTLTFSQPGRFYVRSIALPTSFNANSVWSPAERYDVR